MTSRHETARRRGSGRTNREARTEDTMLPPQVTTRPPTAVSNDNRPADADTAAATEAVETLRTLHETFAREAPRPALRILEALLFAAPAPLGADQLATELPAGEDVVALLRELQAQYAPRGVNLVQVAGKWAFRTSEDLSFLLEKHATQERRLSRAALETLAIIAYHQPVTRAEIEEIRGVATSKGTLDVLLETGWIKPRGRRRAPGKPLTYGTTESFLAHFGLDAIKDLPGLADLKGAGLLGSSLPAGFTVPEPSDVAKLMPDELPLDADAQDDLQTDLDLGLPGDEDAAKPDPETA